MMGAMPAGAAEATGQFNVQLTPLPAAPGGIGQYRLDKQFSGDLVASSGGLMLSGGDPAKGAAGYVAMELVTGRLAGRSGGFALQHSGTMSGDGQHLQIVIVPGSGTGALASISGTMTIRISGKDHFYTMRYELPAAP
ncbi:hypothetical protein CHU93_08210 [Sandarakinorhabdus cyanobacteriorum]|uniref:DUF3224 domain-containing protein n=2 Tax=Sandarakinorhabdus cyanobacteriorum TaxID=1981098 RepID=A0A255YJX0_9SPHN|nr:hypothetical protein CHU93_08210 [Sandarakinorhabdus cyanobacteriorum]